jgi:hypothetical protein
MESLLSVIDRLPLFRINRIFDAVRGNPAVLGNEFR